MAATAGGAPAGGVTEGAGAVAPTGPEGEDAEILGRPVARPERPVVPRRRGPVLSFLRRHWLLLLGAASLAGVVIGVDAGALKNVLASVRPPILAAMLGVVAASYVFRALAWRVALRRIGVPISRQRAITIMVAGQVLIFLPAGDLGRVALVMETGAAGHGAGEVTGSIAFQELLYSALLGLVMLPVIADHPAYFSIAAVLVVVLAAIVLIIAWERPYRWALGVVEHVEWARRFDSDLRRLRSAFITLVEPRTLLWMTAHLAVAVGLCFLLFLLALQAAGAHVTYIDAAFIYALGHILGALSMLPGGLGVYEGVVTGFLALHGVLPSEGAAAALLYRGFNDLVMAALGAGAGRYLRRRWPAREKVPAA